MQCTHHTDLGSPPPCTDDEFEATVVDALLVLGCEGGWTRTPATEVAAALADRDIDLYAIVGDEERDGRLLFAYQTNDPDFVDTLLYVADGSIIGYATLGCSTAEDFAQWYPVQFRGPAWPADSTDPAE